MATLTHETKTRTGWRLRAYSPMDSSVRHSIWLGEIPRREATKVKLHIEAVIESQKLGTPQPRETVRWLQGISDDLRTKLAPVLGTARTVAEALDEFREQIAALKPETVRAYEGTLGSLEGEFGRQQMRSLSPDAVDDWLDGLNVAPNTVAKHAKHVKTFLAWARGTGYTDGGRLETSSKIGSGAKQYLSADLLQRWLDGFRRQPQMHAGLAIAIWAGVRVPSELLLLTQSSVDWEQDRFYVVDSKRSRRSRRSARGPPVVRELPLFPELVDPLRAVWRPEAAPADALLPDVVRMGGSGFVRQCREAREAINETWPRLFTSVRATRETDLIKRFGLKAACEWIGNSPAVAISNYEMITAETWKESVG